MTSTLEQLKEENRLLKAKQQKVKTRIQLYKFLNWVKVDKRIRELRKKLYGTKQ